MAPTTVSLESALDKHPPAAADRAAGRMRVETDERTVTRAGMWLAVHLCAKTGVDVTSGLTTREMRAERIRKLILDRGLADAQLGYASGHPETYRAFCWRALGINLDSAQETVL